MSRALKCKSNVERGSWHSVSAVRNVWSLRSIALRNNLAKLVRRGSKYPTLENMG